MSLEGSDWAASLYRPHPFLIPISLIPSEWQEVARAIHASGHHLVIAVTGGGTGALSALLQTPGASRSVLEAIVPYSLASLTNWIGGQPDQACSEATARAMAMAAFMRARELAPDADVDKLIGVGCTASLATDRPKRGERRIYLALQTANQTWARFSSFKALPSDRASDERLTTALLLTAIAGGCGVQASTGDLPAMASYQQRATDAQSELLLGKRKKILLTANNDVVAEDKATPSRCVFPGAFNPRHEGHLRMAEIAERRFGEPVTWELSIANVDKPPLDFISMNDQKGSLQFDDDARRIALTFAPTFREKAELFPGATFVVGADTMLRIAEPRYYGGDVARRDEAIAAIARQGCRFLVFGRVVDGQFMTLSDLNLPVELRSLCEEVPASVFREDVSSTELRKNLP